MSTQSATFAISAFASATQLTHLHMHTGNLHQSLDEIRFQIQTLFKVRLCAGRVADQEFVSSPHVERFRLTFFPFGADTLLDGFVDESECVGVVGSGLSVKSEGEGVVAGVGGVGRVGWEGGFGSCQMLMEGQQHFARELALEPSALRGPLRLRGLKAPK